MENVTLRTGKVVPRPIVIALQISIDALREQSIAGMLAIHDLHGRCLDPDYDIYEQSLDILQGLSLLDPNGKPHDLTRDVILAMFEGNGINLRQVAPIQKEEIMTDPDVKSFAIRVSDDKRQLEIYTGGMLPVVPAMPFILEIEPANIISNVPNIIDHIKKMIEIEGYNQVMCIRDDLEVYNQLILNLKCVEGLIIKLV